MAKEWTVQRRSRINTCFHLFWKNERLGLVSQSWSRPDLISFCCLAGNSNPFLQLQTHNYPSFPDTPQQNSNYQLPLLLTICDGSWPIIKWSLGKWGETLLLFVAWGYLWVIIWQKRNEWNKTAHKRGNTSEVYYGRDGRGSSGAGEKGWHTHWGPLQVLKRSLRC